MSDSAKRSLLIVVVVIAVIGAAFSAWRTLGADQPVASGVDNSLPPGAKTGKQREIEAMQAGQKGTEGGREEVDLGGAIPGK